MVFPHDRSDDNGKSSGKGKGGFDKRQKQSVASMVAGEFKKCPAKMAKEIKEKSEKNKGDRMKQQKGQRFGLR